MTAELMAGSARQLGSTSLHTPEFRRQTPAETHRAVSAIIAVLFDIVNSASKVAPDLDPDRTQTGKSFAANSA
jgi:hypothetical protein